MAIISINYTGYNHDLDDKGKRIDVTDPKRRLKYKSVSVNYGDSKKLYKTGNFVKDWYNAIKFLVTSSNEPVSSSSSVDHFIMDGANFDSAYLHIENETPVLKYLDRTNEKWYLSPISDGVEFFVEEGTTPTWEELKTICGDIKKEK